MTSVAYPIAYAALLNTLEDALEGTVRISDGYDLSDDPSDVIQLGVPGLTDTEGISEGGYSQEQIGHGSAGVIKETGSINGIAVAWIGEGDAADVRATAFGYIEAISAAVRADRHLGFSDFDLVAQMAGNGDVASDKVNGATCAISFTVNYTALLGA